MASTKRIDLFVTSDKTKDEVVDIAYNRANKRDDKYEEFAHYYDITHTKTGLKYMVFGDEAIKILNIDKCVDILDKSEFTRGFTDEIIVSSDDGTATIELSSNTDNYNVFLTVKDNLQAIARVEEETKDSFKIILYDAETYAEDKVKLDCSKQSVTVNYAVIYE